MAKRGTSIGIPTPPTPVTVFHDTFSESNGTNVAGKQADTVNVGSNTYSTLGTPSGSARWRCTGSGYAGLTTTGVHRIIYDTQQTQYTYTGTFRLDRLMIHDFRFVDTSNGIRFAIYASNDLNQVLIQENTGSGWVDLISPIASTGFADLATYYVTVKVSKKGFNIILNNGSSDVVDETFYNTTHNTATNIGWWNGSSSSSVGCRIYEHEVVA
jgi:hypothetical protein